MIPTIAIAAGDALPPPPVRPRARRGSSRVIQSFVGVRPGHEHRGVREWVLHATRGWRCYRA
jgi:hypothetical protein